MAIQDSEIKIFIIPNRSEESNKFIFAELARRGVMIEGNTTHILVEGIKGKVEALLVSRRDLDTINIHSKEFNMRIGVYRLRPGEDRAKPYRPYRRGLTKNNSKFKGVRRKMRNQIRRRQ